MRFRHILLALGAGIIAFFAGTRSVEGASALSANVQAVVNNGVGYLNANYGSVLLDAEYVLFSVREQANQTYPYVGTDLNGDGDVVDHVAHLMNIRTGQIVNLGVAAENQAAQLDSAAGTAAFTVYELSQNVDFNNDGDKRDYILHTVLFK